MEMEHLRRSGAVAIVAGVVGMVVAVGGFLFFALSGAHTVETVSADAYPSGRTLTLPIGGTVDPGCYLAYGGTAFSSDTAFSKQREIVRKTCGEEAVTEYGDGVLIALEEEGVTDYYLLKMLDRDSFLFYGMKAWISVGEGDSRHALLPFQYIEDARISRKVKPEVLAGAEYQLVKEEYRAPAVTAETWAGRFGEFYRSAGLDASGTESVTVIDGERTWEITFVEHTGRWFFRVEEGKV